MNILKEFRQLAEEALAQEGMELTKIAVGINHPDGTNFYTVRGAYQNRLYSSGKCDNQKEAIDSFLWNARNSDAYAPDKPRVRFNDSTIQQLNS
ncbi:MAG: hypothetical protein LBR10_14565 [Prevotellaceae bacterium]|jgi:hypothetical protein|nr:hypothetical protein [Prevotellaceae bacterium]